MNLTLRLVVVEAVAVVLVAVVVTTVILSGNAPDLYSGGKFLKIGRYDDYSDRRFS
jgi:hypothetical protein